MGVQVGGTRQQWTSLTPVERALELLKDPTLLSLRSLPLGGCPSPLCQALPGPPSAAFLSSGHHTWYCTDRPSVVPGLSNGTKLSQTSQPIPVPQGGHLLKRLSLAYWPVQIRGLLACLVSHL